MYALWYVDGWNHEAGEPTGGGYLVQQFSAASDITAERLEALRRTEAWRHGGRGLLVLIVAPGRLARPPLELAGPELTEAVGEETWDWAGQSYDLAAAEQLDRSDDLVASAIKLDGIALWCESQSAGVAA